jgi:amino acid transporter
MNIVWAALIVLVATAIAVTAMLAVRRRAPEGGYFSDSDRAAGIFGVIATGFSVLLGFLIFLGFESYDASRSGAETEALTVAQQIQTAQLLPAEVGDELTGELVCYARSIIHGEWKRMEDDSLGEDINPWGVAMFVTLQDVELSTPNEEAAYGKWLDQTSTREQARQDRIHGVAGLMPAPLWIGLFFISAIVLLYLFGFADSGDRVWVQALFMGSVVAVIVTMLLLLRFLDDPFHSGVGGLQPVAMERTELLIDQQLDVLGRDLTIPCDDDGLAA